MHNLDKDIEVASDGEKDQVDEGKDTSTPESVSGSDVEAAPVRRPIRFEDGDLENPNNWPSVHLPPLLLLTTLPQP